MCSLSVGADISENEELDFDSDSSMVDYENFSDNKDVVCGLDDDDCLEEVNEEDEDEDGVDSSENNDEEDEESTRYAVRHDALINS